MYRKILLAPLIVALSFAPAFAKPTTIAELGTAPLLGSSSSTAEMRARVAQNQGLVAAAARKIGLTPSEYAQFRAAIDASHVAWVTVPRHLDAMSWQSAGTVYVLRDVVIPAQTNGWEVDIRSGDRMLALYMPAKCGNLSLVRKAIPVVAMRPRPAAPVVEAALPNNAMVAPPVIPDDTPIPNAVVATTEFPPAPAAAHHGLSLAPLLFGFAALAGGASLAAAPCTCP